MLALWRVAQALEARRHGSRVLDPRLASAALLALCLFLTVVIVFMR
jgi:hypothetical protein